MTDQEISALAAGAFQCAENVIDEALREGTGNLKDKVAGHSAITSQASATLTVMLAAIGGSAAYAARLDASGSDPIGWGALTVSIYLMILSTVLVVSCMLVVKGPAVHQEPKNIVAFPGVEERSRKAGEVAILQARIVEQGMLNARRAKWLNRVRVAAICAPFVFAAGIALAKIL